MARLRIVQALCGPARHCILAIPYLPGSSEHTLTRANATQFLIHWVDAHIAGARLDPWCGLCRAPRSSWVFEDEATRFRSLEEAMPELRRLEAAQAATREFLTGGRN